MHRWAGGFEVFQQGGKNQTQTCSVKLGHRQDCSVAWWHFWIFFDLQEHCTAYICFPKYTVNIYVRNQTVQKQEKLCINISINLSIYPLYNVFLVCDEYWSDSTVKHHSLSDIHSCLTWPPGGVAELHFGEHDTEKKSHEEPSTALMGTHFIFWIRTKVILIVWDQTRPSFHTKWLKVP